MGAAIYHMLTSFDLAPGREAAELAPHAVYSKVRNQLFISWEDAEPADGSD